MPSEVHFSRVGGMAMLIGLAVLIVATSLHPMGAHPGDAAAAFAEYARNRIWVLSHLGQLSGFLLIGAGCMALSWRLREGRGGVWALLAAASAVVSLSLAAVLQAVDGVALKFMVDRLAAAAPEARSAVFEAGFAVRQVEIGLASVMGVLFGLTAMLYGIAILLGTGVGLWMGVLGVVSGLCVLASAIVQAHTGFSDIAMATNMFSTLIVMMWVISVGVFLWRTPGGATPSP